MFENILTGLYTLADGMMLFSIAAGVIGGVIVGILPGLTSTMAIALLIPLTFNLPPHIGLAMLGGIYVASTYSGSISAILLNIPGTPASVATALDGNPMSKKGESNRAIVLSTFASCIGGIASVFALLLIAPPLAEFSLKFGSYEYFLLALFGVTVIASLSVGAIEKGFISGALGLLLSTIGFHPLTGFTRFTNDIPSLYDGIPLVVSLIGLFSIPEVISMLSTNSNIKDETQIKQQNNFAKFFPEILQQKMNILRSSIIGIIVGIIPGVGSSIGGFIAYDAAKKYSKKPEEFGKGSPDGIVASETANNAVTGGTLIPLLTLGIPGNPVTAVFLGGIMIHGLKPGAELFTVNSDITYGFILSLFISNLLFVPIGFLIAKYFIKITLIPYSILAPIILCLAVIGSYSIRGSTDDIIIMLFVGILGYVLNFFQVPRAPLILGLVLGTMAESELARSLSLSHGSVSDFFIHLVTRPISLVILLLCAYALYRGFTQHKKHNKG